MKIKLLIATADGDYAEHLSNILSEKYTDTFEVSVFSSAERLPDLLAANRYEVALLEPGFVPAAGPNLKSVQLPLMLIDESGIAADAGGAEKIRKYQRISSIAGSILENYAEISSGMTGFARNRGRITAIWSPSGGSGKTSVALAFAANRVLAGKQAAYLNLENFSSIPAYFQEAGRSISKVFEKLDTDANVGMLLTGIRQQDSGSGILYFCGPENYDDMNILTEEDIEKLINACAAETEELAVDLSSACDARIQKILKIADAVLLVCDQSAASQIKLRQFTSQHNIFGQIQSKTILVYNKGAKIPAADTGISRTVHLPLVQLGDPVSVFKTLSSANFSV